MTTTISTAGTEIVPDLVLNYQAGSESRNVVHQLIGGGVDVSIVPDDPITGTLECFFLTREDAWTARDAFAVAAVWELADDELPELGMTFVRDGSLTIRLDSETRVRWILELGYRAVT